VKIVRIHADEHGESHFAEAEIPLASATLFPQLPAFQFTRLGAPRGIKLFAVPAELSVFDLHTAPERQLAVPLNGTVEYPDQRRGGAALRAWTDRAGRRHHGPRPHHALRRRRAVFLPHPGA
jgi:hypothetical protein